MQVSGGAVFGTLLPRNGRLETVAAGSPSGHGCLGSLGTRPEIKCSAFRREERGCLLYTSDAADDM
eukprot:539584-Rhodomonas_salina.6